MKIKWIKETAIITGILLIYSLIFVSNAPAPPPPPPPPPAPASAPVGGWLGQVVTIGTIAAYCLWNIRKKK